LLLTGHHESRAFALLEIGDAPNGMWISDLVIKRAPIQVLLCRITEPGKFLLAFTGDVASVEESYELGVETAAEALLDHVILQGAHPEFWRALEAPGGTPALDVDGESLLSVECYTVASTLAALDAALKSAPCVVTHLQIADDYGGKGFFIVQGALADLQAVEGAALEAGGPRVVSRRIIARPDPELPRGPTEAVVLRLPSKKK
jgi:microcompartment protein CcmL/EutN